MAHGRGLCLDRPKESGCSSGAVGPRASHWAGVHKPPCSDAHGHRPNITYDWCLTSASEARAVSRNQCQPSNSQGRPSCERQFQPSDMDTMQSPHTCLCQERQSAPLIDPECQRLAFLFTLQCNSCPGRSQSDVSRVLILKPQGSKDSGGFFLSLVPTRQRSMVYTMGTQAQVLGLNGLGL